MVIRTTIIATSLLLRGRFFCFIDFYHGAQALSYTFIVATMGAYRKFFEITVFHWFRGQHFNLPIFSDPTTLFAFEAHLYSPIPNSLSHHLNFGGSGRGFGFALKSGQLPLFTSRHGLYFGHVVSRPVTGSYFAGLRWARQQSP